MLPACSRRAGVIQVGAHAQIYLRACSNASQTSRRSGVRRATAAAWIASGRPWIASATAPAMQASASVQPPRQIAVRTASSQLSDPNAAARAAGTVPAAEALEPPARESHLRPEIVPEFVSDPLAHDGRSSRGARSKKIARATAGAAAIAPPPDDRPQRRPARANQRRQRRGPRCIDREAHANLRPLRCGQFSMAGGRLPPGVLFLVRPDLPHRSLGWRDPADVRLTNGEFGGLYMGATLLSAATLPFLGRLLDRFSVLAVSIGTMVMLSAATVAFGMPWSIPSLLVAIYMLRLFGQGMMTEVALTAIGRWFAANRGRAVSITTIGHRVGERVYPLLFVLVAAQLGWRDTWLVCAGVILLIALPASSALVRVERIRSTRFRRRRGRRSATGRDWTSCANPKFYVISAGALAPAFIGTSIYFHQAYLAELRDGRWARSASPSCSCRRSRWSSGSSPARCSTASRAAASVPPAARALVLLGRLDRAGGRDPHLHGVHGGQLWFFVDHLGSDLARALRNPAPRGNPLDRDRHHLRFPVGAGQTEAWAPVGSGRLPRQQISAPQDSA